MLDFEKRENAVVRGAALFLEQTEEKENIPDADTLVGEMCLRRPALPEQTSAIVQEHGIVVAQVVVAQPPPAGLCGMIAQSDVTIAGKRCCTGGDRQAQWSAIDDGRRPATRRAVEAFAREDDPHVLAVAQARSSDNRCNQAYLRRHDS